MDPKDIATSDDRKAYRIEDDVIVQIYIPPSDNQILSKLEVLEHMCSKLDQSKIPIMLEYQKVSDSVTQLLSIIYRTTPQIAEQLNLINQKIDLISSAVFVNQDQKHEKVNLSATGVSMFIEQELVLNTTVYLRITLPPHYYTIITRARVANCRKKPKLNKTKPYLVGFEFMDLATPDERFLSKHIMKKQIEERQKSRY